MPIRWKIVLAKLLTKSLIWLVAEIVLNYAGLDALADYGEFIFNQNQIVNINFN